MAVPQTAESWESARIPGIRMFEPALPASLFERLVRAVRSTGRRRMKRNYTTTFWLPLGTPPRNVAEEAVLELLRLVEPGPACIGTEWWLGRRRPGQRLRLHFDRDMTVRRQTGQYVHPIFASALYLNDYPSSPTVILDQVPSPDGQSRIPPKAKRRVKIEPSANRYAVFPGNLRHGVLPVSEDESGSGAGGGEADSSELRLSLLVNYWDRRPLAPLAIDYDGTIYPELKDGD